MRVSWLFCGTLAVFWGAALVTAFYGLNEDEETVLVDDKCQCATVTSKYVLSKDNPKADILERNIRIIVPLTSRKNISDPTSPTRTNFVYNLSKLCKKCDYSVASDLENEDRLTGPSHACKSSGDEPCYTYDRNRCYTAPFPFLHQGKTTIVQTALTPESCYPD